MLNTFPLKSLLVAFLFIVTACPLVTARLETVNDEEMLSLIKTENYVVVLFTRKDCPNCDKFENELTTLREDLVDTLNAWVVKATNSQLVRLYRPRGEPAIIFFRHGIPLLYDGPANDEMILHVLSSNKEPTVKELKDDTFEHLTQAATGATTGDWFVMFYTTNCVECQRLQARWESVGAHLKSRMNVARVNRGGAGGATARRFEVFEVPSFVLFRQGKMYRYEIKKYDIESFVAFAQDWYKNVKGERVPVPKSPFDDFTSLVVDYLRQNPWMFYLAGVTLVMGIVMGLLVQYKMVRAAKSPAKKKT